MLVGVSVLILSVSFLVYRHPIPTWPLWIRFAARWSLPPPERRDDTVKDEDQKAEEIELRQETYDPESRKRAGSPEEDTSAREATPSPDGTPKVNPVANGAIPNVPSFTLQDGDASEVEEDNLPPPSFPALNSAQRASAPTAAPSLMPPPSFKPPPPRPTVGGLMPPPQVRPNPNIRSPNNTLQNSGLRIPSTGPLPNRGPPQSSSPAVGSAGASSLNIPKTPNARKKVLLTPGHSPLDWANLLKSGSNLSGVDRLIRVTPSLLKHNNGRKGKPAWSSYMGKVYNITPYLPFHPGGEGELRRAAGKDGAKLFMEVHPWVNWENMLGECVVGIMVGEGEGEILAKEPVRSSLEDMD